MYVDCDSCWKPSVILGKTGATSRRLGTEDRWSAEDLDAPFQLDHVLWFLVETYTGLQNMKIDLADLTPSERQAFVVRDAVHRKEEPHYTGNDIKHRLRHKAPDEAKYLASGIIGCALLLTFSCFIVLHRGYLKEFMQWQQRQGCFEQRAILTLEETLQRQSSEELEIPESGDVFPKSDDRYFPVE
jgi:hypothetical protein